MGFLATMREALALPARAAEAAHTATPESPYAWPNHLLPVELPERAPGPVTRASAMQVPAVARARRLIVGSIARLPLTAYRGEEVSTFQPRWLDRTDGTVSPFTRMLWTVDDLLFYGWSLWALARDADGVVIAADRVPYDEWHINANGEVVWRDTTPSARELCLIPGVDEGLLKTGAEAIRHALTLNRSAAKRSELPTPNILLKQTGGAPLNNDAQRALVEAWARARRGENAGVAFANESVEVKEIGSAPERLLIEGRNAASVDIARATGIPALMLDAQLANASMNYSNASARNAEFIDYCLAPFMAAIVGRLGLDDIVPRGMSLAFDTRSLTSVELDRINTPDDRTENE